MNQFDRLEWPKHHLEIHDSSIAIPLDHVHTVDGNRVDFHPKRQHGIAIAYDFTHIAARIVAEHAECRRQVALRRCFSDLRRVHYR